MRAQIDGTFHGFSGETIFRLTNGQTWQQSVYKYRYNYSYRPHIELRSLGGRHELFFPHINDSVVVHQVSVVCEGAIGSDFTGFDGESRFVFENGQAWEQAEYKYSYHYAYRPRAYVISGSSGTTLFVDGMSEVVRVRRA